MLLLLSFGSTSGCVAASEDEGARAGEALEALQSTFGEGALLAGSISFGTSAAPKTADAIASIAAMYAKYFYVNESCLTATPDGPVVTYDLVDCIAKRTAAVVTGTVSVGYAVSIDGIHARASATDLHVNRATIDLLSEGVYMDEGATKSLDVVTDVGGESPRGRFKRHGAYALGWNLEDRCADLSGHWSSTWNDDDSWATTVTGFHACAGSCPASGTVAHERDGELKITITFDGTREAKWKSSRGASGSIALACTP